MGDDRDRHQRVDRILLTGATARRATAGPVSGRCRLLVRLTGRVACSATNVVATMLQITDEICCGGMQPIQLLPLTTVAAAADAEDDALESRPR